ncbi:hypothetical protein M758_9G151400 [Ceratodon purpureus]|nr:hypothetical protein M758_9G151400 [Ceratodon purpureus]
MRSIAASLMVFSVFWSIPCFDCAAISATKNNNFVNSACAGAFKVLPTHSIFAETNCEM